MADGRFVSYLRVSTAKQGTSGFGMDAQRKAVDDVRNGGRWSLIAELDRLSRDAAFLMNLQKIGIRVVAAAMPEANEMVVGIMAVVAEAERKMISVRAKAALAAAKARGTTLRGMRWNHLAGDAADRVRAAGIETRQAKARGRAVDLVPIIADLKARGVTSLRETATGLNARGIPTALGDAWAAVQVSRVINLAALYETSLRRLTGGTDARTIHAGSALPGQPGGIARAPRRLSDHPHAVAVRRGAGSRTQRPELPGDDRASRLGATPYASRRRDGLCSIG